MPAYAFRVAEPQENREELERQLTQEVRECTEVRITERNHVKRFLMKYGVWQLSEMDYTLRVMFEKYLKESQISVSALSCLHAFDQMKIHAMREEMQTITGRRKYELKYENRVLYLPYYPKLEVANLFAKARDKSNLVWDFTKKYERNLKQQIFQCLNRIVTINSTWERKEKLTALQYLYEYCGQMGIVDLESLTLKQEAEFVEYLPPGISGKRLKRWIVIIELCRKTLFLQADQIHWHAQVWYLERFHFSRERVNPSQMVERISFLEINQEDNKTYLKKYMRYALGITDMALSSIRNRFLEIRNLLQTFDGEDKSICELPDEEIQAYLEKLRKKDVAEKTFNSQLFNIRHFFNFLLVKGYIQKIPFQYELYQKKENPVHHERSVKEEVCEEILSKLYRFPEPLRLMFLHLWCAG